MVLPMGRPKTAHPKTVSITVKMNENEVAVLDHRRKSMGRSTYLRWLVMRRTPEAGHPHPEPHPEPLAPVEPPIPSPIQPPVPPPNPIETLADNPFTDTPAPRHLHRFKRVGVPVRHHQGTPLYQYVCACGETKVDR